MREFIDGAVFREMIICAAMALDENKQQLNELNVFPVPDGDTGTNMSLTISAAAAELSAKPSDSLSAVADTAASSTLRGARGNSGVILSLLFRGMAKSLKDKKTAGSLDLASAMAEGVDAAYKAVMKPAEGTILTVSRVATKAAIEFAEAGSDLELMLVCALESAKEALAETINQNSVLKKAGVVDAGGKGYVIILDAMLASLQGRKAAVFESEVMPSVVGGADFSTFDTEDITYAYCTEFIVSRENDRSPDLLRAFLESIGDSVVIVDDAEIIKTHAHSNEPGKILTEALLYGSLASVKVENMRLQHTELEKAAVSPTPPGSEVAPPGKKFGAVSVCAGEGIRELFLELGVDRIVTGGQTMNPSTEDILREINLTPAEVVFVLPNNKNIIMAAEQCVPLSEKKVIVIPTVSVPEGVSAMLTLDPSLDTEECAASLKEAARRVHTALITYAARDSTFDGQSIKAGEYLGIYDGSLLGGFPKLSSLLEELNYAITELDPDFISVYYGQDVSEEAAAETAGTISAFFPDAEISVIYGGQPVYSYMIAAE